MPATTPAERKALLFIACVAVLGSGARYAQARRAERTVPAPSLRALERQLAVVDSVRAGTREARRGVRERRSEPRSRPQEEGHNAVVKTPRIPHPLSRVPAVIDIDHASAAELETLPGIGPALARRIVANRDSLGPFGSLAELERVPGVGPRLARRIEAHVTFSLTPRHPGGRKPPRSAAWRVPPNVAP